MPFTGRRCGRGRLMMFMLACNVRNLASRPFRARRSAKLATLRSHQNDRKALWIARRKCSRRTKYLVSLSLSFVVSSTRGSSSSGTSGAKRASSPPYSIRLSLCISFTVATFLPPSIPIALIANSTIITRFVVIQRTNSKRKQQMIE